MTHILDIHISHSLFSLKLKGLTYSIYLPYLSPQIDCPFLRKHIHLCFLAQEF